jgi:hypothetical protein
MNNNKAGEYGEPWYIYGKEKRHPGINTFNGHSVIVFGEECGIQGETQGESLASTRRIVACINAMAGIEDPEADRRKADEALGIIKDSHKQLTNPSALPVKICRTCKHLMSLSGWPCVSCSSFSRWEGK